MKGGAIGVVSEDGGRVGGGGDGENKLQQKTSGPVPIYHKKFVAKQWQGWQIFPALDKKTLFIQMLIEVWAHQTTAARFTHREFS